MAHNFAKARKAPISTLDRQATHLYQRVNILYAFTDDNMCTLKFSKREKREES